MITRVKSSMYADLNKIYHVVLDLKPFSLIGHGHTDSHSDYIMRVVQLSPISVFCVSLRCSWLVCFVLMWYFLDTLPVLSAKNDSDIMFYL